MRILFVLYGMYKYTSILVNVVRPYSGLLGYDFLPNTNRMVTWICREGGYLDLKEQEATCVLLRSHEIKSFFSFINL